MDEKNGYGRSIMTDCCPGSIEVEVRTFTSTAFTDSQSPSTDSKVKSTHRPHYMLCAFQVLFTLSSSNANEGDKEGKVASHVSQGRQSLKAICTEVWQ